MNNQQISLEAEVLSENTAEYVRVQIQTLQEDLSKKLNKFYKALENDLLRESKCFKLSVNIDELNENLQEFKNQIQDKIERIQAFRTSINSQQLDGRLNALDWQIQSPLQYQQDSTNQEFDEYEKQDIQTQLQKIPRIHRQTCHYCKSKFDCALDLSTHFQDVHQSYIKKTQVQKQQTKNTQAQIEYTEQDETTLQYTCQNCQKVTKGLFQNHRIHLMIEHNEEEWFKCPVCEKMFIQAIVLARHLLINHSRKVHRQRFIYECVYSSKQMANPKELENHITKMISYHKQAPDKVRAYLH